jgi:hypothetical protein
MAKKEKSEQDQPKGRPSLDLTPAELAGLDFLIKDMEERGETSLEVGFLPGMIVGFLVRKAVFWLVEQAFWYIIWVAVLLNKSNLQSLSEAQMRKAEKMLKSSPTPSLADLKRVRELLREKKTSE